MKSLIVEDNYTSQYLLQKILEPYGPYRLARDGQQAVQEVLHGLGTGEPFDLICLDIMMPRMDGQEALRKIREIEADHGVASADSAKIIMITALADRANVVRSGVQGCDRYLLKPIDKKQMLDALHKLGLISLQGDTADDKNPDR